MRPGPVARIALHGIDRYRSSDLHDRIGDCCRFTPSCSHYGEDALRQRAFPVALLLIAWRLLRCNRLTRKGTVDEVHPAWMTRRQLASVVVLSGLMTMLVAGTASAASTLAQAGSARTAGGCDAFVGGVPVGALGEDTPLQVHKGQRIVVTGLAPENVRNLPSTLQIKGTTSVKIHIVEKLGTTSFTEQSEGQRFQKSVSVDDYLKYGRGKYRVDVVSVASGGWNCTGTFYVELHGSNIAVVAAVAMGAIGAAGTVVAGHAGKDPQPDEFGTYDPEISPEQLDQAAVKEADTRSAEKDMFANFTMDGLGCLPEFLLILLGMLGGEFLMGAALPAVAGRPSGGRTRVYTRGRPILGFLSGLFAGLGTTVALQQLGFYTLNLKTLIIAPLLAAVFGAWRGWRGTAWKLAGS